MFPIGHPQSVKCMHKTGKQIHMSSQPSFFEELSAPGIDDFDTILEADIVSALPFLKKQGVPYYIHAEIPDETVFQVCWIHLLSLVFC